MATAAGVAGGALVSGYLGKKEGDRNRGAASALNAQQIEAGKFKPYNISSPFGSVSWGQNTINPEYTAYQERMKDSPFAGMFGNAGKAPSKYLEDERSVTGSLSPEYQLMRDGFMGRASNTFSELDSYNADDAAMKFLEKMRAIRGDTDTRKRSSLENRLFQQGLLGATGGANQMEALETVIGREETARSLEAFNQAQSYMDLLQNRGMLSLGGAETMDSKVLDMMNMGASYGSQSKQNVDSSGLLDTIKASNRANTGFMQEAVTGLFDQMFKPSDDTKVVSTTGVRG